MSNLSLSNVCSGLTQTQAIPVVSGSVGPTIAETGQMPVLKNSSVSTPLVFTTALVAPPPVAIVPSLSVAAIPQSCTISVILSSNVVTPPVGTVLSVAPSSIASSLTVGMTVSSSSASSSQPSYQPLVVVNTPQLVRPYNGSTSWTSFRDHFARVAKVNRWEDDSTKAQHLMLALEENAAEVLKEISDSSRIVLQAVMGKSQIPILHKNLKSFILNSQIRWPKSKSQIPNLSPKSQSQNSKSESNPKSQFYTSK